MRFILYTKRSAALTDSITAEKRTADTHSIANITPVTDERPTTALIPMSTPTFSTSHMGFLYGVSYKFDYIAFSLSWEVN